MIEIQLVIALLVMYALITLARVFLRKSLDLPKKYKHFFIDYRVNNLHRKIDWSIKIGSALITIGLLTAVTYYDYPYHIIFLGLMIQVAAHHLVDAYFQWKHTQIPKQAIITVVELVVVILSLYAMIVMVEQYA
ncbi:hypothetical protein CR194_04330 [Salipaludibacillus keqinensis]|uniref:Uncharacterized protein n=1 Tax=Salipaludibacillus keqinensis TaxID=2045207 RepID=A0A323TQJ1_9BACI|nr:DUF4181 domain-containing protein [Salipaludibacillus keqinensis]PYZ94763.1 hypothetical protein CR194_04330 [Salipaludibacillus keqinensis]